MAKTTLPFRLGIDHDKKELRVNVVGKDGKTVSATMTLQEIAQFIAILSQCQHALVRTLAGVKTDLPIDPAIAFEPVAGRERISAYEGIRRLAVGVDRAQGLVSMTLLSASDRISEYRMSSDSAQRLGQGLLDAADDTPSAPPKLQ
jgi:hypothetical protein